MAGVGKRRGARARGLFAHVNIQVSLRKLNDARGTQEEHPGFDFRNAEFNGNVPDASKFMGGVSYR